MARWHWNKSGASIQTLYERSPFSDALFAANLQHPDWDVPPPTTTLAQVVAELGLVRFSTSEEEDIRFALGSAIATGMKSWELIKSGDIQITHVQSSLRWIAKCLAAEGAGSPNEDELQAIEQGLQSVNTGLHQVHDIAITLLIIGTLANEIGRDKAHDMVLNVRKWMPEVAAACLEAAKDLGKVKAKGGRPSLDWYDDFWRILTGIAEKNSIRPKVEINRVTGEAEGQFIELAERFEELLPPMLRSPTREAIAKRLQRAQERATENRPSRS